MDGLNTQESFDAWGLVEIMGHHRLAGRITNQAIGGCNFVRVDVPDIDGEPGYTKLYGPSAIFGVTITTEDVARRLARNMRSEPIAAYDLREPGQARLPLRPDVDRPMASDDDIPY